MLFKDLLYSHELIDISNYKCLLRDSSANTYDLKYTISTTENKILFDIKSDY